MTPKTEYFIEVRKKPGLPDGRALALLDSVRDLGIHDIEEIQVGHLYALQGELSESSLQSICEQLLCDPIAEEAEVAQGHLPSFAGSYTVKVTYHRGVTDAIADTVLTALEQLGVGGVSGASSGKVVHLFFRGNPSEEALQLICERVLANPVIQHYEVHDTAGRLVLKG